MHTLKKELPLLFTSLIFMSMPQASGVPAEFPGANADWKLEKWEQHLWNKTTAYDAATNKWYALQGMADMDMYSTSAPLLKNKLEAATKNPNSPIIKFSGSKGHEYGLWDYAFGKNPDGSIARWQGKAVITYALSNSRQPRYALSSDLISWDVKSQALFSGKKNVGVSSLIKKEDGTWYLFWTNIQTNNRHINVAYGKHLNNLRPFSKNPILKHSENWEKDPKNDKPHIRQPKVFKDSKGWVMVYMGQFEI